MTQDEIIEIARQADDVLIDSRGLKSFCFDEYGLEALAKLIRQRFAEECIDLVAFYGGSVDLEAAIRKQGETI